MYSYGVQPEDRGAEPASEPRAGRLPDARPTASASATAQRAPLELAVFTGDTFAVHPLPPEGAVSLGRAEGNDIRVDDPSVSRRHAVLHLGPPLRVEDLGSANGTFVRALADPGGEEGATHNLRPISRSREGVEIALGERVTLGRVVVVVRRPPPSAARARGVAAGAGARSSGERAPAGPRSAEEDAVISDPAMAAIYREAYRAAASPISVLLLGETGVGKEVLAHAIHRRSPRAAAPFIALNCAALPESLLEAELFGHERGSFTGADAARPGLFEAATTGTIFLDEVGELSLGTQVKLLRVLEDRRVFRVGARAPRPIDVRFIAATNRDIEAQIEAGHFRKDLFFRLNGITLTLPPLRDRPAEVAPLAERFIATACDELDRAPRPALSPEALERLERYAFPGNVRELRNIIDRAVVLCDGEVILPEHLPAKLFAEPAPALGGAPSSSPLAPPVSEGGLASRPTAPPSAGGPGGPGSDAMKHLRAQMDEVERRRILEALEQCGGNQTQAAELLGISRRTLINRLDAYEVPRPRKKG